MCMCERVIILSLSVCQSFCHTTVPVRFQLNSNFFSITFLKGQITHRTISSITQTNRSDAVVKGKEPYIPWIISLYKNVCVVMGCVYTCFTI